MTLHPIYRVRRRVLAEILLAGGVPTPGQWRHAALEPFDDRVPFEAIDLGNLVIKPAAPGEPGRRLPGPAF